MCKYTQKLVGGFLGLLLALELLVRLLGLADVPLHSANPVTGYIPLPMQSGRFLNRRWTINNLSMISTQQYERDPKSIILAGDSVVFGGNLLTQSERVGEQLDKLTRGNVFSIAAGSWGAKNALAYFLSQKAHLGDPQQVIFVLNSGDFSKASTWLCPSTHPTSRPLSHTYFAFRKYFWRECLRTTPPDDVVPDFDLARGFDRFLELYPKTKVVIVLYPTQAELKSKSSLVPIVDGLDIQHEERLAVIDLVQVATEDTNVWNESFYVDPIHPSAAGAEALARFLSSRVL
jgi:hypothetical protein